MDVEEPTLFGPDFAFVIVSLVNFVIFIAVVAGVIWVIHSVMVSRGNGDRLTELEERLAHIEAKLADESAEADDQA